MCDYSFRFIGETITLVLVLGNVLYYVGLLRIADYKQELEESGLFSTVKAFYFYYFYVVVV